MAPLDGDGAHGLLIKPDGLVGPADDGIGIPQLPHGMQAAEQKPRPNAGDPGFLFNADGAEIILSRGFKAGKAEDLPLPHGDIAGAGDGGRYSGLDGKRECG